MTKWDLFQVYKADSTLKFQLLLFNPSYYHAIEENSSDPITRWKKAFDKTQHLFMKNTLSRLEIERNFLKMILKNLQKTYN